MPNWCENILSVNGTYDAVKKFAETIKGEGANEVLSFDALIPTPAEFLADGDGRWHSWRCENWGCKWDAYASSGGYVDPENDIHDPVDMWNDGVYFLTAWSPPQEFVMTASEMFPDLTFTLRYYEGGMCFAGYDVLKNGELLETWNANDSDEGYVEFREEYFGYEEDATIL